MNHSFLSRIPSFGHTALSFQYRGAWRQAVCFRSPALKYGRFVLSLPLCNINVFHYDVSNFEVSSIFCLFLKFYFGDSSNRISRRRPTLQIGNTNSRYRFSCGARTFMDRWSKAGSSHHCTIGIGHIADKLGKVAFLLDIPCVRVC